MVNPLLDTSNLFFFLPFMLFASFVVKKHSPWCITENPNQKGFTVHLRRPVCFLLLLSALVLSAPSAFTIDLAAQAWERDHDGPILSLGEPGAFDDTHLFAPCVMEENE
tara:strand:+ start:958 stop:1284 length:327 start_codon:yes stop_codon:yes gene_type:complete